MTIGLLPNQSCKGVFKISCRDNAHIGVESCSIPPNLCSMQCISSELNSNDKYTLSVVSRVKGISCNCTSAIYEYNNNDNDAEEYKYEHGSALRPVPLDADFYECVRR